MELASTTTIRDYVEDDERSWLRCRALAFLETGYFDDVVPVKPTYETPSIELVAATSTSAGTVAGIIDVAVADDGGSATIETVAVHPDESRRGVGTRLLAAAIERLPGGVRVLDAWTREDPAANAWYAANGFGETYRYLHVYASRDAELAAALAPAARRADLTPVAGFFHAPIERERELRAAFARVYVCRRYERSVGDAGA